MRLLTQGLGLQCRPWEEIVGKCSYLGFGVFDLSKIPNRIIFVGGLVIRWLGGLSDSNQAIQIVVGVFGGVGVEGNNLDNQLVIHISQLFNNVQ